MTSDNLTQLFDKTTLGNHIDLSDHYVHLSESYVDLSDIKLTSRWKLGAFTCYKNKILSY